MHGAQYNVWHTSPLVRAREPENRRGRAGGRVGQLESHLTRRPQRASLSKLLEVEVLQEAARVRFVHVKLKGPGGAHQLSHWHWHWLLCELVLALKTNLRHRLSHSRELSDGDHPTAFAGGHH